MVALIWSQDHYEVSRFHERQFAHMLCMNNSTKIQPNRRATQERQKKKQKTQISLSKFPLALFVFLVVKDVTHERQRIPRPRFPLQL